MWPIAHGHRTEGQLFHSFYRMHNKRKEKKTQPFDKNQSKRASVTFWWWFCSIVHLMISKIKFACPSTQMPNAKCQMPNNNNNVLITNWKRDQKPSHTLVRDLIYRSSCLALISVHPNVWLLHLDRLVWIHHLFLPMLWTLFLFVFQIYGK